MQDVGLKAMCFQQVPSRLLVSWPYRLFASLYIGGIHMLAEYILALCGFAGIYIFIGGVHMLACILDEPQYYNWIQIRCNILIRGR